MRPNEVIQAGVLLGRLHEIALVLKQERYNNLRIDVGRWYLPMWVQDEISADVQTYAASCAEKAVIAAYNQIKAELATLGVEVTDEDISARADQEIEQQRERDIRRKADESAKTNELAGQTEAVKH